MLWQGKAEPSKAMQVPRPSCFPAINLPTDDLLRVIITKSFSDKQIEVNIKLLEYILKNVDRSYEKIFQFIKDIDMASLTTGNYININLIND